MDKYGYIMKLSEMSKKLKKARINAGFKLGKEWINGTPKPLTQIQASIEIQVSLRKYCAVENGENNFSNEFQEQRAIEFIEKYLPAKSRGK